MTLNLSENLSDEARLALAHTGPILRDALRIFFELDHRLARIVSATNEAMLGQMRLAWWRDTLGMHVSDRPKGDAVIDAIAKHCAGSEGDLITLVDAWEYMLTEPPLSREAALAFAQGRGAGLAGLASLAGPKERIRTDIKACGQLWALADAASHIDHENERETLLTLAGDLPRPKTRLPAPFRGIAVLAALAERSLEAGGAPLLAGRRAALVALRAGLFGR